ncbi:Uncharacterised protein [uncultured archaeon]|nr:Uncharacterised protein [uncultured archaeon]
MPVMLEKQEERKKRDLLGQIDGLRIYDDKVAKRANELLDSFLNGSRQKVRIILNEQNCKAIEAYVLGERPGTSSRIELDKDREFYVLTLEKTKAESKKAAVSQVVPKLVPKEALGLKEKPAAQMTAREKQAQAQAQQFISKNKWMMDFAGSRSREVEKGVYLFFLEHEMDAKQSAEASAFMARNKGNMGGALEALVANKDGKPRRIAPKDKTSRDQLAEMVLGQYFVKATYGWDVKFTALTAGYESNWSMAEVKGCASEYQIRREALKDVNAKAIAGSLNEVLPKGVNLTDTLSSARKFSELKSNAFYAAIAAGQVMAAKLVDAKNRSAIVSADARKIVKEIDSIEDINALTHEQQSVFYRELSKLYNGNKAMIAVMDKNGEPKLDKEGEPVEEMVLDQYKRVMYAAYRDGKYGGKNIPYLGAFSTS